MTTKVNLIFFLILTMVGLDAWSEDLDFSGHWTIDIRTPEQRRQKVECGTADFDLKQIGEKIIGSHTFATVGCGRINEGGTDTVKGIAMGTTAVLVVTSGRNGGIVFGKARRHGNQLQWTTLDGIKEGEPEGDSPLILSHGILQLDTKSHQ